MKGEHLSRPRKRCDASRDLRTAAAKAVNEVALGRMRQLPVSSMMM